MKMSLVKKLFAIMVLGFALSLTSCSSSDQEQEEESLQVSEEQESAEYIDEEESMETENSEEVMAENDGEEILEEASEEVVMEEMVEEPIAQSEIDYKNEEEAVSEEGTPGNLEEASEEMMAEETVEEVQEETFVDNTSYSNDDGSFSYVVKRGDTVSRIAKKVFGSFKDWQQIASASSLNDANLIFPGQSLTIPFINDHAREFAQSYKPSNDYHGDEITVTIKKGDTLSSLAKNHIGNSVDWYQIYTQNKTKIQNPNQIYVGQVVIFRKLVTAH